jgi:hypothetical protein
MHIHIDIPGLETRTRVATLVPERPAAAGALSCGTAAGAALIAASISMGNAPAAHAVVDADPLTDLIGAFDPNAFNSSDAPTDALGLLGYYTDTYLLGPPALVRSSTRWLTAG